MAKPPRPPKNPVSTPSHQEHEAWRDTESTISCTSNQSESDQGMARRGSQRSSGRGATVTSRREADLSELLTTSQKDELIILVTKITETMLQHINLIFDPLTEPLLNSVSVNVVKSTVSDAQSASQIAKGGPSKKREDDKEVKECVQEELKREALAALRKWQATVIKRFNEISTSKDQLSNQSQQNPKAQNVKPPRASTRGGRGGRGGSGGEFDPYPWQGNSWHTLKLTAQENNRDGNTPAPSGSTSAASCPSIMQFSMEKRQLLMHAIVLLLLSLENFAAYSSVLALRMASHFRVPPDTAARDETRVARVLSQAAHDVYSEGGLSKTDEGKKEKRGKGEGGPVAYTGRLARSLIEARIGAVANVEKRISPTATASVLGTMGTLADGGLAACVFFGICGPRGMVAKTLATYTRDIQDTALTFLRGEQNAELREGNEISPQDRRLRLSIGISGWMSQKKDSPSPWRVLGDNSETYVLEWEDETLSKIGSSLETMATSTAWQNAKKGFADRNVFASLKAFAWPEGLLKISKIVDNPWSMGMVRADKVGQALADSIINKIHGERSVSLLGYGLGARVIYTCLMSLSERRAFGLVENVVMIGTPAPSATWVWTALRSVVLGRMINVFSENDSMLGFLHRTGCVQFGVAGLQRIQNVYGIENVDATKPVISHLRYAQLVGRILKDVGWEDLDMKELAKSEEARLYGTD